MTEHSEILVVGGGPGGLSAATAAASAGRRVIVLDDNPSAGGQIWREGVLSSTGKNDAQRLRAAKEFAASGAKLLLGRRVFDAPAPKVLRAIVEDRSGTRAENFSWERLILATGARERFLPFPGWTLPGVFGAGGLQALVQGGFSVAGKRVVVAGTGPLLPAVAVHLLEYGARVVCIAEQATLGQLMPFAAQLAARPAKLLQGLYYRAALARVAYRTGCWPVEALGGSELSGVRLTDGKRVWQEACDLLACGFRLVANTELAALLGCRLEGESVWTDESQQTSIEGMYCVGEPAAIAGLDSALVEGRIAGLHAVGKDSDALALYGERNAERRFGRGLDRSFRLRPELLRLAKDDTIVCRCEDVRYGDLAAQQCWTEAKLQTRCGMGSCQGRICGPATQTLFGWRNSSIRPPIFPVPLSILCAGLEQNPQESMLEEERV